MKEAPPNPEREIPYGWPKYGMWRGRRIELRVEAPQMKPADLVDVEVDIPGQGKVHPWRGADYVIEDDGDIAL